MQNNETDFLKGVRDSNHKALKAISNDIYQVALTTKSVKMDDEDKLKATLIQGAFYITAVNIAAKAFKKMVDDKEANPENTNEQLHYFDSVVNEMREANKNKMENIKEGV